MFCSKCGAQIPDGSRFCQNCGQPCQQMPPTPFPADLEPTAPPQQQQEKSPFTCPYCGSTNCHPTVKTEVSGGYSNSAGCCGFIFFGPLGLLCGTSKVRSSSETWWNCASCGKEFITRDAALAKVQKGMWASILVSLVCAYFSAGFLADAETRLLVVIPMAIAAFRWYMLYQLPKEQANISMEQLLGDSEIVKKYAVILVAAFLVVMSALKFLLW